MMSGFYQRDIKIKMDSLSNLFMIQSLQNQLLEKQVKINSLEKSYMSGIKDNAAQLNDLHKKELQLDEHMLLMNLIENLRKDYGEIDPGIQVANKKDYMTKYRTHEATYILAVSIAKRLHVYEDYKEFFKNREGTWNIITNEQ